MRIIKLKARVKEKPALQFQSAMLEDIRPDEFLKYEGTEESIREAFRRCREYQRLRGNR